MALYPYQCKEHGEYDVKKPMAQAGVVEFCPECGKEMKRIYGSPPVHYNSDGFHHTDYGKGQHGIGTKADQINKNWSKHWGENPPPPATDQPRNLKRE